MIGETLSHYEIVDMIGADGEKGALEICSDQPLEVVARIYNVSDEGTFGQFLDGSKLSVVQLFMLV